jgi:hypothetical protein
MSFETHEKQRLAEYARAKFGTEGHVLPFELAEEALHESARESALGYFRRHKIKWWTSRYDLDRPAPGEERSDLPTGHLNSSQVACVNHLEPARVDGDIARAVIANVDPALRDVCVVEDDGYVAYEWIGAANYLGEPGARSRGAHVTSLDALMVGANGGHGTTLVAIEWKYCESYPAHQVLKSKDGTDRVKIYRPLLERPDCPISVREITWLFYEPYYQLMRQTLLAWQMVEHAEFDSTDWMHINVVPEGNRALRARSGAAPQLVGETLADAWRSVLKKPARYRMVTPTQLLAGVSGQGFGTWRKWLEDRYLT